MNRKRAHPILHPSDFSPTSRAAFGKALGMAKAIGAELLVAHVLNPALPLLGADVAISPPTYARLQQAAREYAQKQLARLVGEARKAGVRATALLLEGVAADRIVGAARGRHAQMIVMGTHGRSGIARLVLGSVASRVVATATCPVLTVHTVERSSAA